MLWFDRAEKVGRTVLWLAIASVFVAVPMAVIAQHGSDAKAQAEARSADAKHAEANAAKLKADSQPARLLMSSMGPAMNALNLQSAEGRVWFTNVSPRTGIVCVEGVAQNPTSMETEESLPTCVPVAAYSSVHLTVMFAGGSLRETCKGAECRFRTRDVDDAK